MRLGFPGRPWAGRPCWWPGITLQSADPVVRRLAEHGLRLPTAAPGGVITLGVNETWNRTTAPEMVRAFGEALG